MARTRPPSRSARWFAAASDARSAIDAAQAALADITTALEALRDVQSEYQDWLDNLPENLSQSALGEKLTTVTDLDFDVDVDSLLDDADTVVSEAEDADLPMGFGRD